MPPLAFCARRVAIVSAMNRSMVRHATAIFRSYPILSLLASFHHVCGTTWRRRSTLIASSMARANGTSGKPTARHPGSTPNTSVVVVSNVSLKNTSCRLVASPVPARWARSGSRAFWTLSRLYRDTKTRKGGLDMRSCALARWRRHDSPSALKMPPPRMSKISSNSGPLG
uniref:Uncharacterized protein n=1 Tax=Arundo donax TaxID=35708 RepID=A0A0A9FTX5_ARUDO